jgi:hypothetical protein
MPVRRKKKPHSGTAQFRSQEKHPFGMSDSEFAVMKELLARFRSGTLAVSGLPLPAADIPQAQFRSGAVARRQQPTHRSGTPTPILQSINHSDLATPRLHSANRSDTASPLGALHPTNAHSGTSTSAQSAKPKTAPKAKPDENGWRKVAPKKAQPTVRDTLNIAGWSAPVLLSRAEVTSSATGVYLATAKEAAELMELGSTQPLAVLAPRAPTDRPSVPVDAVTTDNRGQRCVSRRFLLQLGPTSVTYAPAAQKCTYRPDTSLVVLSVVKEHVDAALWASAEVNPRRMSTLWLTQRAGADLLDTRPATKRTDGAGATSLQVVATIAITSVESTLRASGKDGIFVRPFYASAADSEVHKVVPLVATTSLAAARTKAEWLDTKALGVVALRRGFGVRVLAAEYDTTAALLRPDDAAQLLGKRWEVTGLPSSMGGIALQEALGTWQVEPLHTFLKGAQRTWVVRAVEEPFCTTLQFEEGLALVRPAAPRPAPTRGVTTQTWQPPRHGAPRPSPPTAWATPLATTVTQPAPRRGPPPAATTPTASLTPTPAGAAAAAGQLTSTPDSSTAPLAMQQMMQLMQPMMQQMMEQMMQQQQQQQQQQDMHDESDGEVDDELMPGHPAERRPKHRRLRLGNGSGA